MEAGYKQRRWMGHRGSLEIAAVSLRAHRPKDGTEGPTFVALMHLGYTVFTGICHCPVLVASGNSLDLYLRVCFRRVDQDTFSGQKLILWPLNIPPKVSCATNSRNISSTKNAKLQGIRCLWNLRGGGHLPISGNETKKRSHLQTMPCQTVNCRF